MTARKKTAAKKSPGKAITNWDAELAAQAEVAADLEANSGGGQFFSVKSGVLTWQDMPLPGNEMAVIVLDTIFENVYFNKPFVAGEEQSPTCFAFARDEDELFPHKIVVEAGQAQSDSDCSQCEHNEWGSANTGKGKACRNTRRLAMIPAGTFNDGTLQMFEEEDHFATTAVGYMKLPVTSVKGYANYVKQVAGALKRPPHGVVTRVSVVPDPKTQFKVLFEPLHKVSDEIMGAIMARRSEVMPLIDFPYGLDDGEEEAPKPKSRSKKKASTRKRKY